nr:T9SS type A sorting domain-containing protein [uncultured Psychroserpens sp.]
MKKITIVFIALFAFCLQSNAQTSDLYLSILDTGSCCDGEKWMSVTTGPDGTGTVIYAQGDGTYSNGSGHITDVLITVTDGVTYYINAYDQYDDGWDGDTYELRTAPAGGGLLVANNGGASPSDGNDEDASFSWGDTQEQELEVSESFTYTPASCTQAELDALVALDDCGNGLYSILVPFITVGDATGVSDGINTYPIIDGEATAGAYASGELVTLEIVHSDAACNFSLVDLFFTCPPANDDLANAETITCGNSYTGDTTAATIDEADAPDVATVEDDTPADTDSPNVWYSFMGTGDIVTLSTCGAGSFDTELFVFTGTSGALTCIDDGYDECGSGDGFAAETTFTSVAGTQYWISVEGWNVTTVGAFGLSVTCVAPPTCVPPTIDSSAVVETCNPDGTGTFTVAIEVSDAGDAGSVFSDGTDTFPVVAGTVTTGTYNSGDSVTIELIAVDEDCSSTVGTFDFTCPPPAPDNDTCATATPIACDETINSTSVGGTGDQEGSGCSIGNNGVWFTFTGTGGDMTLTSTASFDHEMAISSGACGALVNVGCDDGSVGEETFTFESVLDETYYVYIAHYASGNTTTGTIDLTLTCAVVPTCTPPTIDSSAVVETCDPDGTGTFTVAIEVSDAGDAGSVFSDGTDTFPVVAGTVTTGTYNSGDLVTIELISLDEDCSSTVGTFEFTCPQPAPENDDVAGAIDLPVGSTVCENAILGTNVGATITVENDNEADCGFFDPEGDVWFKVMVPATGELTIETTEANDNPIFDTLMTVYSGTSGSLVEIACSDDEGVGFFSIIELTGLTPGDILIVRVWEYEDNLKGNFNICAWSPSSLGVEDNTFDGFTYFPNPVKDVLTLESPRAIDSIEVFNVLGQRIMAIDSQNTIQNIDISNVQSGAYFVKVSIGNQTKTIRVLKE